jgi:hypothetical protein
MSQRRIVKRNVCNTFSACSLIALEGVLVVSQTSRVLEGILWILRSSGGRTCRRKFPHPSTCWRRLRDWEERGVWLNIWRTFLSELNERQQLKWNESFLDGSFASATKGLRSRKNQPGDEVDGGGRRPRSSSGKLPSLCIPGGSQTRGNDARDNPRRAASSRGSSEAETAVGDRRQSVRADQFDPALPQALAQRIAVVCSWTLRSSDWTPRRSAC